ncbi:MAG: rhomboid family intramembrane serine protease [Chitinophagaceae bacterium]|nr:rhomboid family intramembrane serine protease [Chitinophagaceae bacterium]
MELSITLIIIIITSLISFSAFSNERLMDSLIFYPPAIHKNNQWYRFFSNGLLHADLTHLLFNMFALYIFGRVVESQFGQIFGDSGRILYFSMYVLALGACLIPTYNKNKNNHQYRSLGASGAVSAVIFASILLNPLMGMGLLFIPIYIAGFLFGFIYLAISSWLDRKGGDNINHSAHIFGALFGIIFLVIASRLFSPYPVLENFIEQIKNMNPGDIIRFGSSY